MTFKQAEAKVDVNSYTVGFYNSEGLSSVLVNLSPAVFKLLRDLVAQGTTVFMVEQNVKSALKYSDTANALESGSLVMHKPASEILADPNMDRLFLGTVPAV